MTRLAICVFTHHGRRDVLNESLTRVLTQLEAPALADVEVCLTDNASHDGTEALVAELKQSAGERLRYLRHDRDLGASRNLLSCVDLAQSDYCWILSSDDAIEDGGVARVLELISWADRAPGVVVGKANFDFTLTKLTGQGGTDFYPPEQRRTLQYGDTDSFLTDCGLLASVVSTLIVRRDSWLSALAELGGISFADTTLLPHLPTCRISQ
jgi:glycosyltransferase involved in cell wall biosynthesis